MKRFLILLLTALLLTGCVSGSYVTKRSVANQNSHSFSMRYNYFNGTKVYTINAKEENLAVKVDIQSDSGDLAITIAKDGEAPAYTGNQIPTSSFTVYLKEPGKYTVTVTAQKHCGSFSLDWGK